MVGRAWETPEGAITAEEIAEFASRYDPQFLHLDPEAAQVGPFQGMIASGFHTLAAVWALWLRLEPFGQASGGGIGIDALRWLRPVRPGDRLRARVEVLECALREHSSRGRVVLGFVARNQRGEEVLTFRTLCLIARRPEQGR